MQYCVSFIIYIYIYNQNSKFAFHLGFKALKCLKHCKYQYLCRFLKTKSLPHESPFCFLSRHHCVQGVEAPCRLRASFSTRFFVGMFFVAQSRLSCQDTEAAAPTSAQIPPRRPIRTKVEMGFNYRRDRRGRGLFILSLGSSGIVWIFLGMRDIHLNWSNIASWCGLFGGVTLDILGRRLGSRNVDPPPSSHKRIRFGFDGFRKPRGNDNLSATLKFKDETFRGAILRTSRFEGPDAFFEGGWRGWPIYIYNIYTVPCLFSWLVEWLNPGVFLLQGSLVLDSFRFVKLLLGKALMKFSALGGHEKIEKDQWKQLIKNELYQWLNKQLWALSWNHLVTLDVGVPTWAGNGGYVIDQQTSAVLDAMAG